MVIFCFPISKTYPEMLDTARVRAVYLTVDTSQGFLFMEVYHGALFFTLEAGP